MTYQFRLSGILIISDYDFMKFVFSQRSGSHRISTPKITLDEELREIEYGMFHNPTQILNLHQGSAKQGVSCFFVSRNNIRKNVVSCFCF